MKMLRIFKLSALCICCLATIKQAQASGWLITYLQPAGYDYSEATNVASSSAQVGRIAGAATSGNDHAALWSGTSAGVVDLNPSGATSSRCLSSASGYQYGFANSTDALLMDEAGYWTGTAASWTDLNPKSCDNWSYVEGGYGAIQVGRANWSVSTLGNDHAGFWNGTSASWVDLNPSGCNSSDARAAYGSQIVGCAFVTALSTYHAGIWNTSGSSSFVDINPSSASFSNANGVYNGQQVGAAMFGGVLQAGLWNGTSNSWVNLQPSSGYVFSEALGVNNGWQVGYAAVSNGTSGTQTEHAMIWNGTSANYTDLGALLPVNYGDSVASGVYVTGHNVYVVGTATDTTTWNTNAVLWNFSDTAVTISGTMLLGDFPISNPYAIWNQVPAWVELQNSTGTALVEKDSVTLNSSGAFSFATTQIGTFTITAKAYHWLAKTAGLITIDGFNNVSGVNFGTLLNGDINNDNFVEDQDYSLMGASWYLGEGDAGFNPNADLNGDGYVEDQDYSILGKNWYLGGDPWF
jgi:hypothetical protein